MDTRFIPMGIETPRSFFQCSSRTSTYGTLPGRHFRISIHFCSHGSNCLRVIFSCKLFSSSSNIHLLIVAIVLMSSAKYLTSKDSRYETIGTKFRRLQTSLNDSQDLFIHIHKIIKFGFLF